MLLVFDIEADNLREDVTKIHCISTMALGAPVSHVESFYADHPTLPTSTIENGLEELSRASTLIGHNIINYDLPILKKLYNWEPSENTKIFDTLVVSRLLNPDRRKPEGLANKIGPHSLEAWGYRLGRGKVSHEDWSVFSPAMLRRCEEDVEITALLYNTLQEEMKGNNWKEAIDIEHEVARIITQQEINGVRFDIDNARSMVFDLDLRISRTDNELIRNIPKRLVVPYKTDVSTPFKKDGSYSQQTINWIPEVKDNKTVVGPFTRISWEDINLSSHPQVKDYLLSIGWQPTEWNYKDGIKSSPKLTEDSYESITGSFGSLLKSRSLCSHRRSQIQGWLETVRGDGRITAGANTCGTNTSRFRHQGVVNVPKADPDVFYGREMRSLFIASPGRKLVGHDASGLELRMLAHFMNDPAYTWEILNGDIHSENQRAAGLPTRNDAKTFIYAFLYGAGDEKIGSIVGGDAKDGRALKQRFLSSIPSLDRLIKSVRRSSKKGYLKGLDGRKIWMRRSEERGGEVMEHKALNTLLQASGAIVMKKSMILLDQDVTRNGLDVLKVIDMHDEAQADVLERDVEKYIELAVNSIVNTGKHFNLNCPLAADAKVGLNWAETH